MMAIEKQDEVDYNSIDLYHILLNSFLCSKAALQKCVEEAKTTVVLPL